MKLLQQIILPAVLAGYCLSGCDADSNNDESDTDNMSDTTGCSDTVDCDNDGVNWYSDCDDNDPAIREALYEDVDGDGEAGMERSLCRTVADTEEMDTAMYTFLQGKDCNDSDPSIAPYSPDIMGDGVDRNCDGVEQPLECHPGFQEHDRPCPVIEAETICESGADLLVWDASAKNLCSEPIGSFVLANIGNKPYEGTVLLKNTLQESSNTCDPALLFPATSADHLQFEMNVSLAAGEQVFVQMNCMTEAIEVVLMTGEDCDTTNNRSEHGITNVYAQCE